MRSRSLAIAVLVPAFSLAAAAAEFLLTFQPAVVPAGDTLVTQWNEKDMRLSAPAGNMRSRGDGYVFWQPSNGTDFVAFQYTTEQQPAVLTNTTGIMFALKQVDLAEYSSVSAIYPDIQFVGHRADGSTVTNIFVLDRIIDGSGPTNDWQRFTFSAGFTNLSHVKITQPGLLTNKNYSMDNIRVSTIVTNAASITDISSTNSVITLTVSGLSMMASNLVERSHDLLQSNWTAAAWFVSSNASAQWTESVSNNWTNVFYRVRSR